MNIGDVIDGYEIIENIGSGGMGTVYKVLKNSDSYALKTCTDIDEETIRRFKREVRIMKSIDNSNIINVVDDNLDANPPYFVMPLCDHSLKDAVINGLTEDQKFEYARQLCIGVKSLHDVGIIHRDIKPANTLILAGIIKIADMGLGKFVDRDSTIITSSNDRTIGTLAYVSPEIYLDGKGRDANKKSDIYSIGKLLYYVFSGGENPQFIDTNNVTADIYSIINKCIKIYPASRYGDISEIINDLTICQKLRETVVSIKDIVSQYHTGVNDVNFTEQIYQHLFTTQGDLGVLIRDLRAIGRANFELMLKHKTKDVSNIINLFLSTYETDKSYWIQFEDVDVLVSRVQMLLKETDLIQEKQDLLAFAIEISKNYNRFPAMEMVGNMLHDFSDEELRLMALFFSTHKENINTIKDSFKKSVPDIIRAYIR
ncbi:MAG: serine/threonine-protein kinase [Dysgonomonas mossii]|uniref:serine/threonine-protein kinase n=1 Tax=Dysgonomonas mossii TaxID=163665 RepID=UPI003994A99C